MAFQGNAFQGDAFQTGRDEVRANRAWLTGAATVLAPITRVSCSFWPPRGGDYKGAATGAFEYNYNQPALWQRVISPGQRFIDVAVPTPQGWWVQPVTVAVELATQLAGAGSLPVRPVETFYPNAWPPVGVSVNLAPVTRAGEIPRPWAGVETFYAQAWPTAAATAQAIRTALGVAQIVAVIDTLYPQAWHARVATTLTPVTRQAVAQVVAVIDTFYPQPWSAAVSVTLAPITRSGEIARPWKGVETFYPLSWPSAAQTTLAPRTAAFVVQIVTRIDTFVANAWTASVNTILAPVTRAAVAQIVTPVETFYPRAWLGGANVVLEARSRSAVVQVVEPVDTFYPQAWAVGAATGVQLRTWAGEVPRTPQIVETLYLRGDWNWRSATLQQRQTATAAIYVHQDYQPPPTPTIGGNWVVAINVRQLAYTNINWPGIGSIAAWAPPEAPTPPDVVASTFIHRHRRRGRR